MELNNNKRVSSICDFNCLPKTIAMVENSCKEACNNAGESVVVIICTTCFDTGSDTKLILPMMDVFGI